ncbi:hypothetical protein ACHQM5_013611 [Ranunculus cassubicifolius]
MKILEKSGGALTNFEVLEFLRSRGASTETTRVFAPIAPSEFQVYDYLVQTAACNQTRDSIDNFLKKCEKSDLAKAEKINIINIRPTSAVELDPIIEQCENRMGEEVIEELVEMIVEILQPPPKKPGEEDEETASTMEEGAKTVASDDAMQTSSD